MKIFLTKRSLFKLLIFLLLFSVYYIFKPLILRPTYADMVSYDFLSQECSANEEEVLCGYSTNILFRHNNCKAYELSPNYRYLAGTGSTFGGRQIYCYNKLSGTAYIGGYIKMLNDIVSRKLAIPLLITLLIELPVFFFLGFRTRKHMLNFIFVNFISVPLINLTLLLLSYEGLLIILILEIFVVLFEAATLILFNKKLNARKITQTVIVANLLSFILGGLIMYLPALRL